MLITENMLRDFKQGRMDDFYSAVYPSLIVYASRMLGNDYSFLAEDCVQDSIYKVYQLRDSFSSATSFKSYIYTAVHNKAISYLRKDKSMHSYMSSAQEESEDLQTSMIQQETLDLLYSAIDSLPEHLHKIFEMSFEQGLHNDEVAELLNISISAVKKRKHKMLSILKDSVGEEQLLLLLCVIKMSQCPH